MSFKNAQDAYIELRSAIIENREADKNLFVMEETLKNREASLMSDGTIAGGNAESRAATLRVATYQEHDAVNQAKLRQIDAAAKLEESKRLVQMVNTLIKMIDLRMDPGEGL